MKNCHHPNIVRLIEEFETEDEIYLILEYVKVTWSYKCLGLHQRVSTCYVVYINFCSAVFAVTWHLQKLCRGNFHHGFNIIAWYSACESLWLCARFGREVLKRICFGGRLGGFLGFGACFLMFEIRQSDGNSVKCTKSPLASTSEPAMRSKVFAWRKLSSV